MDGLVQSDGCVDTYVCHLITSTLAYHSPSMIFDVNETMSCHKTLYSIIIIIEQTDTDYNGAHFTSFELIQTPK